jgi:hypothetical protein
LRRDGDPARQGLLVLEERHLSEVPEGQGLPDMKYYFCPECRHTQRYYGSGCAECGYDWLEEDFTEDEGES